MEAKFILKIDFNETILVLILFIHSKTVIKTWCSLIRGTNDEKSQKSGSQKSGYSGFPVSGVRIMSGYFDKFLPLLCLRK